MKDAFDIDVIGDETVAKITIPFADVHVENLNQLAQEIVNEIDDLTPIPRERCFYSETDK